MSFTLAFDVTAPFFTTVPQGFQLAGYDTGKGIAWTAAMWAAHPGAVHIDQAPDTAVLQAIAGEAYLFSVAGHVTADVLDCEAGAVPVGSPLIAAWVKAAQASYATAARPGQRRPALYCSADNVTANVNALVKGGITFGELWIANWTGTSALGIAELAAAAGPFPVIGAQFKDDGDYDSDVFSTAWLDAVSGNGWVFGPCRNVTWKGGITSFEVTFTPPGTPEKLSVGDYEIAVCEGEQFITDAPGYPRYTSTRTNPEHFQGGSLKPKTKYTGGVRAIATNGAHAGPWVTGKFSTGG